MNEEDFVDINIDDVEDPGEVIPDGKYLVHVDGLEKKHKAGSEYPYLEARMHPLEGSNLRKKLRVTLSFHPNALWNMKAFVQATKTVWDKGFHFKDMIGKDLYVTVGVKPHPEDPDRKLNEVGPPYAKA